MNAHAGCRVLNAEWRRRPFCIVTFACCILALACGGRVAPAPCDAAGTDCVALTIPRCATLSAAICWRKTLRNRKAGRIATPQASIAVNAAERSRAVNSDSGINGGVVVR